MHKLGLKLYKESINYKQPLSQIHLFMIQNPGVSCLGLRSKGIVCNYNDIIALCANSAEELRLVASVQTSHFLIPGLCLNHVCLSLFN